MIELLRRGRWGATGLLPSAPPEPPAGSPVDGLPDPGSPPPADLGPLAQLLADDAVTEVMVNGPGPGRTYVERLGAIEATGVALDARGIDRLLERVILPLGLRLDQSSPTVEARLGDGSRLHAVIPPIAPDGPCLTIRRPPVRPLSLDDFDPGPAASAFLDWALTAGWNLLVSGATGTGKTAFLGALSRRLPTGQRLVTIEETAELRLAAPHVVRLESRTANAEGLGAVDVRHLVRAALRMRPDRLVVGEVRGAEAFDLLQALNTGHAGSLSTIHANGPDDALARLELLVSLAGLGGEPVVRAQVRSCVDGVVHLERGWRGRRVVAAVAEVVPEAHAAPTRLLFRRSAGGELVAAGLATRPPRGSLAPREDGSGG